MSRPRSGARREALTDLLITAIENYGYGWFEVHEYRHEGPEPYAVISPEDEPGTKHRVDLDVIANGLRVIREARPDEAGVLRTASGESLGFGGQARELLLAYDRTNGDDGDVDVIGALAVVECALFGKVIYA